MLIQKCRTLLYFLFLSLFVVNINADEYMVGNLVICGGPDFVFDKDLKHHNCFINHGKYE